MRGDVVNGEWFGGGRMDGGVVVTGEEGGGGRVWAKLAPRCRRHACQLWACLRVQAFANLLSGLLPDVHSSIVRRIMVD